MQDQTTAPNAFVFSLVLSNITTVQSVISAKLPELSAAPGLVGCRPPILSLVATAEFSKKYHYLISMLFTYVIPESLRPKEEKTMVLTLICCRSLYKPPPHPDKVTSG